MVKYAEPRKPEKDLIREVAQELDMLRSSGAFKALFANIVWSADFAPLRETRHDGRIMFALALKNGENALKTVAGALRIYIGDVPNISKSARLLMLDSFLLPRGEFAEVFFPESKIITMRERADVHLKQASLFGKYALVTVLCEAVYPGNDDVSERNRADLFEDLYVGQNEIEIFSCPETTGVVIAGGEFMAAMAERSMRRNRESATGIMRMRIECRDNIVAALRSPERPQSAKSSKKHAQHIFN